MTDFSLLEERLIYRDEFGHVFCDHTLSNCNNTSVVMSLRSVKFFRRACTSDTHVKFSLLLQEGLASCLLGKNVINHVIDSKDLPILIYHCWSDFNMLNIWRRICVYLVKNLVKCPSIHISLQPAWSIIDQMSCSSAQPFTPNIRSVGLREFLKLPHSKRVLWLSSRPLWRIGS